MSKLLLEDFGNLKMVDLSDLRYQISNELGNLIGKNSQVRLVRDRNEVLSINPTDMIGNLGDLKQNSDNIPIVLIISIVRPYNIFKIIKHGYDDTCMATFTDQAVDLMSNIHTDYLNKLNIDRETIVGAELWEHRNRDFNIKSSAGIKKVVTLTEKLALLIYAINHKIFDRKLTAAEKNEALKRVEYQIVYVDMDKIKLQGKRLKDRKVADNYTKNNKTIPSNAMYNKEGLKARLKAYLQSKLPNFENVKDIPRSIEIMKEKSTFKIKGVPYKIYDTRIEITNPLNYITFRRIDNNGVINNKHPYMIMFIIEIDYKTGTMKVQDDIYAYKDYTYNRDPSQGTKIEDWDFSVEH